MGHDHEHQFEFDDEESVNGSEGGHEEGPAWSGTFGHISRANHSCVPNAGWRWDEESSELRE